MIKKRHIWYINLLLLVISLGIALKLWFSHKPDAWHYIPNNAFLVIESSELQESLYSKKNIDANKLADMPFFYDVLQQLKNIAKGTSQQSLVKQFLEGKQITYSLHREAKKNLEFITYIPLTNFSDNAFIDLLQNPTNKTLKIYSHEFKNVKVHELYEANNELITYYFVYDDFMISSKSAVLLEEAISNIKSGSQIIDKQPFTQGRFGFAHVYFNSKNLTDIADLFPSQLSPNLLNFLSIVTPTNPDIVFTKTPAQQGVSSYIYSLVKKDIPFLNIFNQQKSKEFGASKLIPENTSILLRLGFNDTKALRINFNQYIREFDPVLNEEKDSVNRLLDIDVQSIFSLIKDEVIFCEMEAVTDEPSKKIVLMNTPNVASTIKKLDDFSTIAEKYATYFKHKPFSFLNFYVRKLEISQFPALLFGSTFRGFAECYYTQANGYVVLANSEDAMKDFLTNLNEGQTWDKLDIYSNFLKRLDKNAQVTAIVSPQRTWNNVYYSLQGNWRKSAEKHEQRIKGIRLLAYENHVVESKYGARLLIEKTPAIKEAVFNQLFIQDSIWLAKPVAGSPILMYNPDTKLEELLVQDVENKVSLYDSSHKAVNSQIIDSQLKNHFINLDFYHNGKLQHLAQSQNAIYVFNRHYKNGLEVYKPNIPLKGEIKAVATSASKVYVADAAGQIFAIEGATQKITKIPTSKPYLNIFELQVVPIQNNNFLGILQRDGTLSVIYDNGTPLRGFPVVPLSDRPAKLLSYNDEMMLISETGEIKMISAKGEVKKSEVLQLERPDKITQFEILFDQKQSDWLIVRRTPVAITIFDKHGKSLINIDQTNTFGIKLRYFDLGNDIRVIAIFDGQRNTFFDLRGKQLGNTSLVASDLPYLSYLVTFNKLFIYNPNKHRVETWTVKIK